MISADAMSAEAPPEGKLADVADAQTNDSNDAKPDDEVLWRQLPTVPVHWLHLVARVTTSVVDP